MMMVLLKLPAIFQWLFVSSCLISLGVSSTDQNIASASDFNGNSGSKRFNHYDAFDDDIDRCLFTMWTAASGNTNPVLSGPVQCNGQAGPAKQLCYSLQGTAPAQFAVCYNTDTLTPEFTGHIVEPVQGGTRDNKWRTDVGIFAPYPQAAVDDYKTSIQKGLFQNFNFKKQFYCAKGHLTPNADFADDDERSLTMITTNIAPQWQNFNAQNWARLEKAVRAYSTVTNRKLYVFTGVGGEARNQLGDVIELNHRVLAPEWYWKAVCDPLAKQSVVLVGENAIGITDQTQFPGCNGIKQTRTYGVVYCFSLDAASARFPDFQLPPFSGNCNPSVKGTFLDMAIGIALK